MTTDTTGEASLSVLATNGDVGAWDLDLNGLGDLHSTYSMSNVPGDAATIEQTLSPQGLPADGIYSATVAASKAAGASQISANVAGSSPEVSASTPLSQTSVTPVVRKPVLRLKRPPRKRVKAVKIEFRFVVVIGKARSFRCRLDQKKWSKCKPPLKVKFMRGKHIFRVRRIASDGSHGRTLIRKSNERAEHQDNHAAPLGKLFHDPLLKSFQKRD